MFWNTLYPQFDDPLAHIKSELVASDDFCVEAGPSSVAKSYTNTPRIRGGTISQVDRDDDENMSSTESGEDDDNDGEELFDEYDFGGGDSARSTPEPPKIEMADILSTSYSAEIDCDNVSAISTTVGLRLCQTIDCQDTRHPYENVDGTSNSSSFVKCISF